MCLQNDMEVARNMKLLLYFFELISDLKINFSKSEVVVLNGDNELVLALASLLNCKLENSLSNILEFLLAHVNF